MVTGSEIIDSLTQEYASRSVVSNNDQSVILMRSVLPAVSGNVDAGVYLKIGLCMSAGGRVQFGHREWQWKRGTILITAPHEDAPFRSPEVDMIGIAIKVDGSTEHIPQLSTLLPIRKYLSRVVEDPIISSVLIALWHCAEQYGADQKFIIEGVTILLNRLVKVTENRSYKSNFYKLSSLQLEKINQFIDNRLEQAFDSTDLANHLGLNTGQLGRALKAVTGDTTSKYVLKRRMNEAKKKLLAGVSVTDVSMSVGYNNPSKFSSAFKRLVGCSPSQWKQANQADFSDQFC